MENLSEIFGTDSEDEPIPKKKAKRQSKRKKRAVTPVSDEVSPDEAEAEETNQISESEYSD